MADRKEARVPLPCRLNEHFHSRCHFQLTHFSELMSLVCAQVM